MVIELIADRYVLSFGNRLDALIVRIIVIGNRSVDLVLIFLTSGLGGYLLASLRNSGLEGEVIVLYRLFLGI